MKNFELNCHFSHISVFYFSFVYSLPIVQSYINLKKLKKTTKNDVLVNGSQRCERRVTCTSRSGLLSQYAVHILLHVDVRMELKTAVSVLSTAASYEFIDHI